MIRVHYLIGLAGLLIAMLTWQPALAGVTLDGSFGKSGSIAGPQYNITSNFGKIVGNNLFQSFSQFNIMTNEAAIFSGPTNIQNILSRVTGGASCSIDGTLKSTINGANLFLISPGGIMFGPNARLDLTGSFYASTADYMRLGTNGRFDATTPGNSVLTVDPPSAFGFLSNSPNSISVNGSLLQVSEGQSISLVGGNMSISNGNLYAPSGTINLISVASAGEATFSGNNFNTDAFNAMGQISITETRNSSQLPVYDFSSNTMGNVDVSGSDSGGQVYIRGGQFVISGGSIYADTYGTGNAQGIDIKLTNELSLSNGGTIRSDAPSILGTGSAGDITINAAGTVSISGYYVDEQGHVYPSGIYSETFNPGNAGNISITSGSLSLFNAGTISTDALSLSTGSAGDITINATGAVSISGLYDAGQGNFYPSGIYSETSNVGNSGNISITSGSLSLSNAGTISTDALSLSMGSAGDITINAAGPVSISGYYDFGQGNVWPSAISSSTGSSGNAGNITITSGSLSLSNAGEIRSDAFFLSTGAAGDITINATGAVSISGYYDAGQGNVYSTEISSSTNGPGNAGNISITSGSLSLSNAGYISTDALFFSTGTAGAITINATGAVSISGYYDFGQGNVWPSYISSSTLGPGNAGNISITSGSLSLSNAGAISTVAQSGSTGSAGEITIIAAGPVSISGYYDAAQGIFYPSYISSDTFGSGNAGNIFITSGSLALSNAGDISTDAASSSAGIAGDITINAAGAVSVYGAGQGNVIASAITSDTSGPGKGGNISITSGSLSLSNAAYISTDALSGSTGAAGDITIIAAGVVSISGYYDAGQGILYPSHISSDTFGPGNAGNISIITPLFMADEGAISSSTASGGAGGNIDVSVASLQMNSNAYISSESTGTGTAAGPAGNITINANGSINLQDSSITTATENADGGNMQIQANNMLNLSNSNITATVKGGTGNGGNITIDPFYVILDHSEIIANAFGGNGGNISITSNVFIQDAYSNVSASSQYGLKGTVVIHAPIVDVNAGIVELPEGFLNPASLSPRRCAISEESSSSFVLSPGDASGQIPYRFAY